jgi:hypothetical protein
MLFCFGRFCAAGTSHRRLPLILLCSLTPSSLPWTDFPLSLSKDLSLVGLFVWNRLMDLFLVLNLYFASCDKVGRGISFELLSLYMCFSNATNTNSNNLDEHRTLGGRRIRRKRERRNRPQNTKSINQTKSKFVTSVNGNNTPLTPISRPPLLGNASGALELSITKI